MLLNMSEIVPVFEDAEAECCAKAAAAASSTGGGSGGGGGGAEGCDSVLPIVNF
jgi:hypothetical protein